MSPRRSGVSNRRRNALIGGAGGLSGATLIAAILIATTGGTEDMIPPHGGAGDTELIRVDLLASRDLDTSTPCTLPAGGAGDNKPFATDQTWTRTGGSSCFPISATAAQCFDATEIPYTVDSTGIGWAVEPDSVNRVPYNTAIDCTNWNCRGTASATPLQTAPDGSATATAFTVSTGLNDVYTYASGYAATTTVYPRLWLKCSSGSLTVLSVGGGAGSWTVDCSAIGGAWTLLTPTHAAVTGGGTPWVTNGAGQAGQKYVAASGTVTASVWAPTITEEPGTGLSVIPTGAAAVSTGDIGWTIANPTGVYYRSGDTVTQSLTTHAGTCWVADATELQMSGAAGSECAGVWYGLEVTR